MCSEKGTYILSNLMMDIMITAIAEKNPMTADRQITTSVAIVSDGVNSDHDWQLG